LVNKRFDAIVVGGGPAGSSCAQKLVQAGARVAVLDRAQFPRLKLCAGWITPQAIAALELKPADYPHRFNTFDQIVAHVKGLSFSMRNPQHSIRRFEFDNFLLQRCGAEVIPHTVKHVERVGMHYLLDNEYECEHLVGAGGTRCPVYKQLFRAHNPRARELQAATYEYEFPYDCSDERCHLWFFDGGLPGYSWYVPKADGYLNCGVGGMAELLKARGDDVKSHWQNFVGRLRKQSLIDSGTTLRPKGYSYYLRGNVDTVSLDNAYLVGDAAGLATRDLCEGIGPAIYSGQRAAHSITTGTPYVLEDIDAFSSPSVPIKWLLEYMFVSRGRKHVRAAETATA
jgi:flavin-dependent dehydrogenase